MINALTNKSILVTGGTGFIGQYIVSELIKLGNHVTILSRYPSVDSNQKYNTIVADLVNSDLLVGICQGIDIVFHLGGSAHAENDLDDYQNDYHWQVTVDGTKTLLNDSIKSGVSRFLFVSSVKVMGESSDECLDETSECRPTTGYGKAKYEAERIVLEANLFGITSTVLRLPMVYGPGCKGNLPRMIQAVNRGRFPPLPETGNKKSMVDVRDVTRAAVLAATNPVSAGNVYIVTDGQTYSTRQIYEMISKAVKRPIPRIDVPLPIWRIAGFAGDILGKLSGHCMTFNTDVLKKIFTSSWYSSEKIGRDLNYHPVYTLKSSLPDMVASLIRS